MSERAGTFKAGESGSGGKGYRVCLLEVGKPISEGFGIFLRAAAEEEFTRIATLEYGDDPTLENRFNVTGDTAYYCKVRGYHRNQYSPYLGIGCGLQLTGGLRLIITNPGTSRLKVYGVNNGFFTSIMR